MVGAIISRGEAQVMRLACLYALLDRSTLVRPEHLKAALALWDYSEKSAKLIFGEKLGDRNVDRANDALRAAGKLTLTEVSSLFGRHLQKDELARIVGVLMEKGMATMKGENDTEGRPVTVIYDAN